MAGARDERHKGMSMSKKAGTVGVAHHNGWAVFVTAAPDGTLLDRRRVELVDGDLPCMPYHGPGQRLPLDRAVELVEQVRVSADRCAEQVLEALASELREPIRGIALHKCPKLPATVAERIQDYWAQCNADSVMYRQALADAAESRGWTVYWYDKKKVLDAASAALGVADIDEYFRSIRETIGPPWRKDHSVAMAAAIVAASSRAEV